MDLMNERLLDGLPAIIFDTERSYSGLVHRLINDTIADQVKDVFKKERHERIV